VEAFIQQRALRFAYLPSELLCEPAWDMLLELFHAELSSRRLVEPILCKAARVSTSSGSRWIDALVEENLCIRSIDPSNTAAVFVKLSAEGFEAMRSYFAELIRNGNALREE
jgi:DNA-binding MarR family transcriptional regulator